MNLTFWNGFKSELSKFAETKKEKRDRKINNVGAGLIGLTAPNMIAKPLARSVAKGFTTTGDNPKLYNQALSEIKREGYPILSEKTNPGLAKIPSPAAYLSGKKGLESVVLEAMTKEKINKPSVYLHSKVSRPEIALHELGHAKLHKAIPALSHIRGGGAIAAGLSSYGAAFTDKDSTISKASPYIAAAGMAPMLADEFHASHHAVKKMKEFGATASELSSAKKNLWRAGGTYGIMAGSVVAAPMLIRGLKKPKPKE